MAGIERPRGVRLLLTPGMDVPHDLEGLPLTYGGAALLPHPALARWVKRRVRDAVAGR
jgi:hypothetical protein